MFCKYLKLLMIPLVLLTMFSCNAQENTNQFPLVYQSPKGGLVDIIRFRGNIRLNEVLTLNADSTYVYKMCAQLEKGKWYRKNDSIFLHCESIRFHIDSLNYSEKYVEGTICGEEPDVWLVKKSKIVNGYDKSSLLKQ